MIGLEARGGPTRDSSRSYLRISSESFILAGICDTVIKDGLRMAPIKVNWTGASLSLVSAFYPQRPHPLPPNVLVMRSRALLALLPLVLGFSKEATAQNSTAQCLSGWEWVRLLFFLGEGGRYPM